MTTSDNLATEPLTASRPKSRKTLWAILAIFFALLACCFVCVGLFYLASFSDGTGSAVLGEDRSYTTLYGEEKSENRILSIPIKGPILNEGGETGFSFFSTSYVYGYDIKQQLMRAAEDESIKAVILEIDSPGGTITGSKAISDGVEYYRTTTGKPVYSHVMGTGASGGFWAAVSADRVYVDHGSLVGSIGVIFGPFKYYQGVVTEMSGLDAVTTKDGIETFYITSGTFKDFGNPYREMASEEVDTLQQDTDTAYEQFVEFVSERRKLSPAIIKSQVMALPYGEQQALELKLIDAVGSKQDAYTALATEAGIAADYRVVREYYDYSFWSLLLSGKYLPGSDMLATAPKVDYCQELCGKMLYLYGDPQTLK